ncbi:hypothetical protein NMY22_g14871 [Coprinellus aureogranulatus]|nr:hypothetical protein NMY22_g14871 [Coprinellus aureogranulatus]
MVLYQRLSGTVFERKDQPFRRPVDPDDIEPKTDECFAAVFLTIRVRSNIRGFGIDFEHVDSLRAVLSGARVETPQHPQAPPLLLNRHSSLYAPLGFIGTAQSMALEECNFDDRTYLPAPLSGETDTSDRREVFRKDTCDRAERSDAPKPQLWRTGGVLRQKFSYNPGPQNLQVHHSWWNQVQTVCINSSLPAGQACPSVSDGLFHDTGKQLEVTGKDKPRERSFTQLDLWPHTDPGLISNPQRMLSRVPPAQQHSIGFSLHLSTSCPAFSLMIVLQTEPLTSYDTPVLRIVPCRPDLPEANLF